MKERLPLFLPSVARLSACVLTRGFASQPYGWFAFIGKEPSKWFCWVGMSATAVPKVPETRMVGKETREEDLGEFGLKITRVSKKT